MPETEFFKKITSLPTERLNPVSENIDSAQTREILEIINDQDKLVPLAVEKTIPEIEIVVEKVVEAFKSGGRLFYFGAGTSGRLGVVDASEIPPTFGADPELVQGVVAGGSEAMFVAQEGAEDSPESGAEEVGIRNVNPPDVVCGLAASGRTPFVIGALKEAANRGCFTAMICACPAEVAREHGAEAEVFVCPIVGPEVVAGSSRMKAGTAQKLVLNMITTASMIKLGKTFGSVMVDLQATNAKLVERSRKTVMRITGVDYDSAADAVEKAGGSVKTAIVMSAGKIDRISAEKALEKAGGFARKALANLKKRK